MIQSKNSEKNDSKSSGMSRASLKRKRKSGQLTPSKISGIPTSVDTPSQKQPKNVITPKTNESFASISDSKLSILDILAEVDVVDVTAEQRARKLISTIVHPIDINTFFNEYWDKTPMHCTKGSSNWLKGLASKKIIEKLCDRHLMEIGEDINLSKYSKGKFECFSDSISNIGDGEEPLTVKSSEVWENVSNGYCITLLQPQRYIDNVWKLLSALEFEFSTMVGANISYIPTDSLPSGPVVSDGDRFILQITGTTLVKLFEVDPASLKGTENSRINQSLLPDSPFLTAELIPGDSLYIPSSWVFIVESKGNDSLIVEIFTSGNNKGRDFMNLLLPQAVEAAAVLPQSTLRQSIQRKFSDFMGVSSSENEELEPMREQFMNILKKQFDEIMREALNMADAAADQIVKNWIGQRLPVPLSSNEESRSSSGFPSAVIYPYTKLRMIRPGIARAVVEDGMVIVYHCMDNARTLYGAPLNPLEFELDDGPAIEGLLKAYPEGVVVSDLYHPSEELDDKVSIAQALYKEGILLIEDEASKPQQHDTDDDNEDDPF